MRDPFDTALYYDATDSERLSNESPEEAIDYLLDQAWEKGESILDTIRRVGPIEVTGYVRRQITDSEIVSCGDWLTEWMRDRLGEEYGDPEGQHDIWSEAEIAALELAMRGVVAAAAKLADVWQCEPCGTRTYQPEEVEAIMREGNPDLFSEGDE